VIKNFKKTYRNGCCERACSHRRADGRLVASEVRRQHCRHHPPSTGLGGSNCPRHPDLAASVRGPPAPRHRDRPRGRSPSASVDAEPWGVQPERGPRRTGWTGALPESRPATGFREKLNLHSV